MLNKYFLGILVLFNLNHIQLLAQSNYVANTPNSTTPGFQNTLVGPYAGNSILSGMNNTFIGWEAGRATNSGSQNTFIGFYAGQLNTTGFSNTFLGNGAGASNLNGAFNNFMGAGAGFYNTKGLYNTLIGHATGQKNVAGNSNTVAGSFAGFSNQNGHYNVIVGDSAGYNNTVSGNVIIGSKAGVTSIIGQKSTFVGFQSGYSALADSNTFVGYQSGYMTTTGKGNTFFGTASGRGNTTGSHNTFVGNGAGPNSGHVDDNVYVGYNTGRHDSGSHNTLVGTNADVLADNLQNATAIGAGAAVAISNALVLGNDANVGIGTSAPSVRLEVVSPDIDDSGLRLSKLTTNSPASHRTDQFLTVNERGDVVKARYQLRISNTAEWSDAVFAPAYHLRPLATVATYVRENGHLPGIPSAKEVVKEGVDLVRMNAMLLEKVEELTLYLIQQQKRIEQLETRLEQKAKP